MKNCSLKLTTKTQTALDKNFHKNIKLLKEYKYSDSNLRPRKESPILTLGGSYGRN
jgi:hypothetical protein